MPKIMGYAAKGSHSDLKPYEIERSEPLANQVKIDIEYCGVCHSDVHQVKNEWKNTVYPCMPGHEIIGRVSQVGAEVTKFSVGDTVGVGCMIDSCLQCESCQEGEEQFCEDGALATYNGNMKEPSKENLTFGGYSSQIVVREDFVLRIPPNLSPAAAAPLLCAGITTYSPMRRWEVGKGTRVGIVGFGGLGHVAIKIAKALGAEVTIITSKPEKAIDAQTLGVDNVIISSNSEDMKRNEDSLDFILSTIPQSHDANPFLSLLARDGILTIVGCLVPLKKATKIGDMVKQRKTMATSIIGGIAETQEVLDFCAKHDITANVKVISMNQINEAFKVLDKGEADFRYVIDMKSLKDKEEEKGFWEGLVEDA